MIGLVTMGHGHFATGMRTSMELVTGSADNITFIDFEVDDTPETLGVKLDKALDDFRKYDGIVILCDLAGGTPYKVAAERSVTRADQPIQVIGSISLPMILEGVIAAEEQSSPEALAEELMECARDSLTLFRLEPMADSQPDEDEDGI